MRKFIGATAIIACCIMIVLTPVITLALGLICVPIYAITQAIAGFLGALKQGASEYGQACREIYNFFCKMVLQAKKYYDGEKP